MAQVFFIGIVDHASGKVCTHSDTSFAYRSRSGKTYTTRRDVAREYKFNPTQLAQQENFKIHAVAVHTFIKGASTSALEKLQFLYKASDGKTYPSFNAFIWKNMDFVNKVVVYGGWKYASDGTVSLVG